MKTSVAPPLDYVPAVSGPGAFCVEAQADGVPCTEIRDCAVCGRAHPVALPELTPAPAIKN